VTTSVAQDGSLSLRRSDERQMAVAREVMSRHTRALRELTKQPPWPIGSGSSEVAMQAHSEPLAQHGGGAGVRDSGLLESAMARCRYLAAHRGPDNAAPAASCAYATGCNQAFVAGNKLTAAVVSETLSVMNGCDLTATDAELVAAFLAPAAGDLGGDALADWFRDHLVPA